MYLVIKVIGFVSAVAGGALGWSLFTRLRVSPQEKSTPKLVLVGALLCTLGALGMTAEWIATR